MQLGFVIDHSRCIGCHACTVACKSENSVPVGSFRTWVKYTEQGEFPAVRRSFAVLRCNQCTNAPCVTICPVSALSKRSDGIVDVDPAACIGCKACMHGCPYDALYINDDTGTAEKCHFCAHRTEIGLAPACAVVCPTEAIVPGDFHDPESAVSTLRREHELRARKTEAGTGPNVFYRDVTPAGIDPGRTNLAQGSIWSEMPRGPMVDAQLFESLERQAEARTVYDVPRKLLWGGRITGYLFAKSLAAGILPVGAAMLWSEGVASASANVVFAVATLLALAATGGLLVADLKRPSRFYLILLRPNWNSWLARGTFAIVAYSILALTWILVHGAAGAGRVSPPLYALTVVAAGITAAYTGWLFAQAKGRVLWMKRGYWLHLLVQAFLAGAAATALLRPFLDLGSAGVPFVRFGLAAALALQLAFTLLEGRAAPARREAEYARAHDLVVRGPWASRHWRFGVLLGTVIPLGMLFAFAGPWVAVLAAALALVGLWVEEDVFVRAGQALPIS